jgi:hypothetical protein
MKKLSDAGDLFSLTELKSFLEQEGIPCLLKNELMIGLSGEVPINESSPQLWVANDEDEARARELLKDWRAAEEQPASTWGCPQCNELVEGQFTSCWNCGAAKPGTSQNETPPTPKVAPGAADLS